MMIVVTDGKADKGSEAALADVAKKQRDGKVTMVAVGVGRQFSREQLLSIAGKKENVLEVSSFKNLDSLLETLRQVIIESAITILEGANLNATNELAQSQQGIATHISETSNIFLGAPGSFDRIGSVFSYGGAGPEYYRLDIDDFAEYNTSDITYNLQFLHDSYLGYSLSSGKFLPNGTEFVVAGMPRFDSKGIVLIYEASNNNNHIKVKPTGEYCQLGAYFGHSVLTVDANNDGLDDLMVSSPLYSEERSFDQGRVFVFINNPVDPLLSLPGGISSNVLMGSNKGGSRFGMSLMIAGDVDRNGYDDIIIGAPHEDDATGAVYLYFGSEHGFSNKYMERISGSVFGPIRHFGYATFGGKDMDFDGYPDVVVAAPSSDTIVVLRSRPVVDVMARIETDVSVINVLECLLDSPELCAQFNVCMKASYRFGNTSQVFDIQYDIDVDATKLLADRRLLLVDKQNEKAVLQISEDEICWICNLKINPSPFANLNDLEALSQPIEIKVAYAFTEEHTDVVMSPVLDPVAPNYVEDIWLVKPICENETCESNLSMTATYS
uniref:Integrin alpha-2-like n=1 Tax=Phallusia mammillata TaxID=59560 RepID=A0A6F9DEQ1_9ASCI|nr:integrin alpha-2-like [Phallusia mammillata]